MVSAPHAVGSEHPYDDQMMGFSPNVWLASAGEAPAVAELQANFDAEFNSPCPAVEKLAERFHRIIAGSHGFVVLTGERAAPVGHALVTLRPTIYYDGPLGVLDELYIQAPHRSHGYGTLLLQKAVAEVQSRGGSEIHINVDEQDHGARRFYERHGFTNIQPGEDFRMLCYLKEL